MAGSRPLPARLGEGSIKALPFPHREDVMRNLFLLLALLGVAGVVLGVLTILHSFPGQTGPLPFRFENHGGPGPILAGLILILASLYLRSIWRERE
jgi:hypothetical protein